MQTLTTAQLLAEARAAYGDQTNFTEYSRDQLLTLVQNLITQYGTQPPRTEAVRQALQPIDYTGAPWNALPVQVLREECNQQGIPRARSKDGLIENLTRHFRETHSQPLTLPIQTLFAQYRERTRARRIIEATAGTEIPIIDYTHIPLEHLTVSQIKEELRTYGYTRRMTGILKAQLLQALREHLNLTQPRNFQDRLRGIILNGPANPQEARQQRRAQLQELRQVNAAEPIQLPNPTLARGEPVIVDRNETNWLMLNYTPLPGQEAEDSPYIKQPLSNPYLHLSAGLINYVAQGLDFPVTGTAQEKAEQIHAYDQIMPKNKQTLMSKTLIQMEDARPRQLILYGLYHGLNMRYIIPLRNPDTQWCLVSTITLLIFCRNSRQPRPEPKPLGTEPLEYTLVGNVLVAAGMRQPHYGGNRHRVTSPAHGQRLWRELVEYPTPLNSDNYMYVREWAHYAPSAFDFVLKAHGHTPEYIECLDPEDKIFLITRGYPLESEVDVATRLVRRRTLMKTPDDVKTLLVALYSVSDQADPLSVIARKPAHTWEPYLTQVGIDSFEAIMAQIGMVPPPNCGSRRDYFRANFVATIKTLQLTQTLPPEKWPTHKLAEWLAQFPDIALMQMSGAYVSYSSRESLISTLVTARTHSTFFVPLQRQCRNGETVSGEKTTEIQFLIAYGTLVDYFGYSTDELYNAFSNADLTEFEKFRRPDAPTPFTTPQIQELLTVLRNFSGHDLLVARINEGLAKGVARNDSEKRLYAAVAAQPKDQQQLLRDFIRETFDAGMYMRRWEGPGNPYPIREGITQRGVIPDANVSQALTKLQTEYTAMPTSLKNIVHSLCIVQWPQATDDVFWQPYNQASLFHKVNAGNYCIRMASSRFIWTAIYYLRLFFGELIPGFNPQELAVIS